MDRLRDYYQADSCLVVVQVPGGSFQLRKSAGPHHSGSVVKTIPESDGHHSAYRPRLRRL